MLCCSVPVSLYQAIWTFRKYFTALVKRVDLRSTYLWRPFRLLVYGGHLQKYVLTKKESGKSDKNKQFLYQVKSKLGSSCLICSNPKPNPNPST